MKKENFENALENISDERVSEAAESYDKKTKRRKFTAKLLIPAAILLLLSAVLTVNAASPVDIGSYISLMFGGDHTMVDDMISMPEKVSYRSSGDEMKLELKGVMGDAASAIIYFDIVVSPEVEIPERWYFDVDYDELCLPWDGLGLGGSYGTLEYTVDDDGSHRFASYVRVTQSDALMPDSFNMSEQAFYVTVNTLGGWKNYPDNPERYSVLDGKWTMALQLNYRDVGTTYHFGEEYVISQPEVEFDEVTYREAGDPVTVVIDRIGVSPIGISCYFSLSLEEDAKLLNELYLVTAVRLKDGGLIAARHGMFNDDASAYTRGGSSSGRRGDDGRWYKSMYMEFNDIVDVSQVESFIISNVEIPLADAISVN